MTKLTISRAIIVEGKYDKIKLDSLIDGLIITTDGFGLFKNNEKRALLKRLAAERGLIVLSDSDSAGRLIRNHLYSFIPKDQIVDLYIPRVPGKERRKAHPSKEGTLGVEGIDVHTLYGMLEPFKDGAGMRSFPAIDRETLYLDGFSGGPESANRRKELAAALGLPPDMSAAALIRAINLLGGKPLYDKAKEDCKK